MFGNRSCEQIPLNLYIFVRDESTGYKRSLDLDSAIACKHCKFSSFVRLPARPDVPFRGVNPVDLTALTLLIYDEWAHAAAPKQVGAQLEPRSALARRSKLAWLSEP